MNNKEKKIVILACYQTHFTGVNFNDIGKYSYPISVNIVRIPCSGNIDVSDVLKLFSNGINGVMIIGCPQGVCKHSTGNIEAQKKVLIIKDLLFLLGINPDLFQYKWIKYYQKEEFFQIVNDFIKIVE